MRSVFFVLFVLFTSINYSQEVKQDSIYTEVQVLPEYSDGGMDGFRRHVMRHFNAPTVKKNIIGEIIIECVVEKDGTLTDCKIVQDLGFGTGKEGLRVVKNSKKWNPGFVNGVPVRTRHRIPIKLSIQNL